MRQDKIVETAAALFVEARTQWQPWLRSTLGLRHDEVDARVTATGGEFNLANGGKARAGQTSPKLGVVLGPVALPVPTEFYANWGQGFHSDDARGATSGINPADGSVIGHVPLLVRAGARAGPAQHATARLETSVRLWQMDLASELVFIGDEGVTEPKGASRRHGLEWANALASRPGVSVEHVLALSHARFRDAHPDNGGPAYPTPSRWSRRWARPATPAGAGLAARACATWAPIRWKKPAARNPRPSGWPTCAWAIALPPTANARLDVLNLFDRKANDIEYWGGACTRGESASGACGGGIDGRLVHPLEPRTLRLARGSGSSPAPPDPPRDLVIGDGGDEAVAPTKNHKSPHLKCATPDPIISTRRR